MVSRDAERSVNALRVAAKRVNAGLVTEFRTPRGKLSL
jgi:hypothetical protein